MKRRKGIEVTESERTPQPRGALTAHGRIREGYHVSADGIVLIYEFATVEEQHITLRTILNGREYEQRERRAARHRTARSIIYVAGRWLRSLKARA